MSIDTESDPEQISDEQGDSNTDTDSDSPASGVKQLHDEIELVETDRLVPYVNNAKKHPEEQVDKIASAIKNYGFDQAIVADENLEIIKGHGRLQASKKLGLNQVPVIVRDDLTDAEKKASRIADNRVAESEWDDELLASEIDELDQVDYDLLDTGFDPDELDDYLALVEPPEFDEDMMGEDDGGEEIDEAMRVVVIAENESDAEFVSEWCEQQGLEFHISE
jgi:ParB-like chromosome segregation protein Spo0J